MEVIRLGNLYREDRGTGFAGNVWDKENLCPTITTMQGGGREPMIIANINPSGNGINGAVHTVDAEAPTITTNKGEGSKIIVAMRGRNPDNPSNRTVRAPTEQRLEPNSQGICNTLTSVQKDNLVMEKVRIKQATSQGYIECEVGGVADLSFPDSNTRRGRVQENGNVCPTLTSENSGVCRIEKGVCIGERDTIEILRILRDEIGEKDFSEWAIRGLWCVLQEEVLRQNVYAKGVYENWRKRPELWQFAFDSEGNQYSIHKETSMRDMWESWTIRCSPQGRELSEQQHRQFDDFMQKLPHETTQREKFVYYLWKAGEGIELLQQALYQIQEVWRSDVCQEQRVQYRIRKLSPLECWRLMDFTDEDFEKAAQVNSNTQLYKQAGNSIVRNVLVAILGQMIPGKEDVYSQ